MFLENVSLKSYNTFGIDVKAKHFATFQSERKLIELISTKSLQKETFMILGGGSNILFQKDFDGIILKNEIKGKKIIEENTEGVLVKVGGGENWHEFVLWTLEQGFYGIENLSLIPGTVGAAPIQNIGAYGVELKDVFHSLEAVHLKTKEKQFFFKKDCDFGYRNSIFKRSLKNQCCIINITLRLSKRATVKTTYGAIQHQLAKMNVQTITPKAISDAIIQIRSSKLPNPSVIGNAGSFFKNPEINKDLFQSLQLHFPNIVYYNLPNDRVKIPAGWLIEQCGWKGKIVGNTGTYKNQALVLVNHGNATGLEILELSKKIQESVNSKFGIQLEREVNIL